jgi:hypothetical protein
MVSEGANAAKAVKREEVATAGTSTLEIKQPPAGQPPAGHQMKAKSRMLPPRYKPNYTWIYRCHVIVGSVDPLMYCCGEGMKDSAI